MSRATVSFTGVTQILSCDFTLSNGVDPSVALLRVLPQGSITSNYGTLTLEEDGVVVQFIGCHVRFGSIRLNRQGQVVAMEIEDRRWRWKHSPINGLYNVPLPDGSIDPASARTPQQLATLLFQAMGEIVTESMVAELPNNRQIEVDWVAADAERELERLCWRLGCRVSLGLDNVAYIRRLGTGSTLPRTNAKSISVGVSSAAPPEKIGVLGAEVLVQSKLRLLAVGLDRDGSIVPIHELSYMPSGGWTGEYENLFQSISDPTDRALALLSVFKWYRVDAQADGSLNVPGYDGVSASIGQIFPVANELLQTYTSGDVNYPMPAYIEGTFKLAGDPDPRVNSEDFALLEEKFTLVGETGLVKFEQPVVKQSGDGTSDHEEIEAADLYLTTSYAVRNYSTGQTERYYRERTVGPTNFGTRLYRDEGIQQTFIASYDGESLVSLTENTAAVDVEAEYLLDAISAEYTNYEVGDVLYVGLVPLQPTGVLRQVGFQIDSRRGCNTRASFNGEFDRGVLSHEERRRLFDVGDMAFEVVRHSRRRRRGQR